VKNEKCAECHEPKEAEAELVKSAHTGVRCEQCHIGHEQYPHPEKVVKPQCSQCHQDVAAEYSVSIHAQKAKAGDGSAPDCAFCHGEKHSIERAKTADARLKIPENCGMCHDKALAQYKTSVHGTANARGISESAVCSDCHSPHKTLPPRNTSSAVNPLAVPDTCAKCHGDLKLMTRFGINANTVTSFANSFHGLALKTGETRVAECASCHGYHEILPSSDPHSTVHPKQIAQTCGKCHPGAGSKFQIGRIHNIDQKSQPLPVKYAELFYVLVIPGTIGFMFVHQLGDFLRKLFTMRFRGLDVNTRMLRPDMAHPRMHRMERIQHFLLAVSFITLGYTGFALHYADAWWARPMLQFEKNIPVRGVVHRTAAVILVIASLMHLISLLVNRKLREHWLELLPRVSDVREMVEGTLWRLGLRKEKPYQSPHSYIEKAEYWALVWGTVVMAVTGAMLWFNNWTLATLPKMWIDFARVVHYYEAVLACLAILVWHFYMVLFDPEVYPMDPAWLTGHSPRVYEEHKHK
jgi:formate dehydrogenase gamma subunit